MADVNPPDPEPPAAAEPPEVLLPMFKTRNFYDAYKYSLKEIYTFLREVVDNPAAFGVPDGRQDTLRTLKLRIMRLSIPISEFKDEGYCDGYPEEYDFGPPEYVAQPAPKPQPSLETWAKLPIQHIRRAHSEDYKRINKKAEKDAQNASMSKFSISGHSQYHKAILNRNDTQLEFWNPCDLLGLFLSLMGPAPGAARKRDYYLPLTAVYGRWCAKIASNKSQGFEPISQKEAVGISAPPTVFQCTWEDKRDFSPQNFFLGSSLAGFSWGVADTGLWETVLKRGRYNLLRDPAELEANIGGGVYSFDLSVTKKDPQNPKGVRFGNCGETYPFLAVLSDVNDIKPDQYYGLALKQPFLKKEDYDPSVTDGVWKDLMPPCGNCDELLNRFKCGTKNANFDKAAGISDSPLVASPQP